MTLKIAIYDRQLHFCSELETLLIDILKEKDMKYDIETFQNRKLFYQGMKQQRFNLIFLQVGLHGVDVIEISRYVREYLRNYIVKIVYLSEIDCSAKELCEFAPMGYLPEPLEEERVKKVIDRYLVMTEQVRQVFRYRKRSTEYKVPYSEIMYLESIGHKIAIYTTDKKDEFYGTIENVYKELENHDFLRVHQSIIVNYHFIEAYRYGEVEMTDRRKLSISRTKQKEIYKILSVKKEGLTKG